MSRISIGLLSLSLTAGVVVIIALVTPGWFGFSYGKNTLTVSMSGFYINVCYGFACNSEIPDVFVREYILEPFKLSPTRYRIEASLSLVSIVVGTIFTAVFAVSEIRRERSNSHSTSCFRVLAIAGIVCIIIGVVCGGILCSDLIKVNIFLDDRMTNDYITFPYSIMLMVIGMVMEVVTMILTGFNMRSMPIESGGTASTPAGKTAFIVVQEPLSVPMKQ